MFQDERRKPLGLLDEDGWEKLDVPKRDSRKNGLDR